MLRTALLALGVVFGGPAVALLVIALGCNGASPALGTACGHNLPISLAAFSVAAWFVLAVCVTLIRIIKNNE